MEDFCVIFLLISFINFATGQLGPLKYSSILILTKNQIQLEPIIKQWDYDGQRRFQEIVLPQSAPCSYADFDFEHDTNRLVIIAKDNDPISKLPRLFLVDFSRIKSETDWDHNAFQFVEFVDRSNPKPHPDRIRFNYTSARQKEGLSMPASFLIWSRHAPSSLRTCRYNLASKPKHKSATLSDILTCRSPAFFQEDLRNIAGSLIGEGGDWRLSDLVGDIDRQLFFAILNDVSIDGGNAILTQRKRGEVMHAELLHLVARRYLTAYSFRIAYDSARKEAWVLFVETEPEISINLHKLDPHTGDNSLRIEADFGENVYPTRAVRLSIHKHIGCLSLMTSSGRPAVVAIRINPDSTEVLVASVVFVEGLIGAVCLTEKSTALLTKFAPPIEPPEVEENVDNIEQTTSLKHLLKPTERPKNNSPQSSLRTVLLIPSLMIATSVLQQ